MTWSSSSRSQTRPAVRTSSSPGNNGVDQVRTRFGIVLNYLAQPFGSALSARQVIEGTKGINESAEQQRAWYSRMLHQLEGAPSRYRASGATATESDRLRRILNSARNTGESHFSQRTGGFWRVGFHLYRSFASAGFRQANTAVRHHPAITRFVTQPATTAWIDVLDTD